MRATFKYLQLGRVAEAQRQWAQARDFWLKDLAITVEFDDEPGLAITLRSLARLWQATRDPEVPAAVGAILSVTPGEVETQLSALLARGGLAVRPGSSAPPMLTTSVPCVCGMVNLAETLVVDITRWRLRNTDGRFQRRMKPELAVRRPLLNHDGSPPAGRRATLLTLACRWESPSGAGRATRQP